MTKISVVIQLQDRHGGAGAYPKKSNKELVRSLENKSFVE